MDNQTGVLEKELRDIVENDRYPLSPRILTLREILNKIRPESVREPLPPSEVASRRARGGIGGDVRGDKCRDQHVRLVTLSVRLDGGNSLGRGKTYDTEHIREAGQQGSNEPQTAARCQTGQTR
jgi:hypothetical protein